MHPSIRAALVAAVLFPFPARGAVLGLEDALERARRAAPAVLAARLRPAEARGRLAGASALLHDNPVVEAAAGRRDGDGGVSTDIDTSVSQNFELGGRRRARIEGARAEVEREAASADEATREVLREVAATFLRALAARDRLAALRTHEALAADLLRASELRHHAGDIAALDLNVARVAAARARMDVRAAEVARDGAVRDLKVLLGMEANEPLELRGDLRVRRPPPLEELLHLAAGRPDVRALAAEVEAAEAEARLGEGHRWPDVGLRLGYQREEGADIPRAGVAVSLPVFVRGQEQRIAGQARARRLRIELEARRRAIEVQVRAAFEAHARLAAGIEDLEQGAVPFLDDNDALARRGHEAGELGLLDYLVVRRETLAARLDYVERALEAALATVDLESRAGVLR